MPGPMRQLLAFHRELLDTHTKRIFKMQLISSCIHKGLWKFYAIHQNHVAKKTSINPLNNMTSALTPSEVQGFSLLPLIAFRVNFPADPPSWTFLSHHYFLLNFT